MVVAVVVVVMALLLILVAPTRVVSFRGRRWLFACARSALFRYAVHTASDDGGHHHQSGGLATAFPAGDYRTLEEHALRERLSLG